MNEIGKTTVFIVIAAVAVGVAAMAHWLRVSKNPPLELPDIEGKPLFPDFTAPLSATSMEIVEYDEDSGESRVFEVALVDDKYSIPSHSNYPADAKDQLAEAATSMVNLEVVKVESDNPADHEMYGVLDPDPKTQKPGAVGVGTRVT